MKLHVFLRDELAATLNTGPRQLTSLEEIGWTAAGGGECPRHGIMSPTSRGRRTG